ncbi:unnamed protein product [Amoebophrya sp. A120]|nr:unnamed protein product [Amoebophrya sp. A120]|eukprot:GSA120T00018819001.1
MIICLGPVCCPIWPVIFLVLKPLWNYIPEERKKDLKSFWDTKCYPWVKPVLDLLPTSVRKFLFYGMPSAACGGGKKQQSSTTSTCCPASGVSTCSMKGSADGVELAGLNKNKQPNSSAASTASGVSDEEDNWVAGEVVYCKSEEQFEALRKKAEQRPMVLDFTASWCKPCQKLKPVFAQLAAAHSTAAFVVIDVDELEEITSEYEVTTLPAFWLEHGTNRTRMTVTPSEQNLKEFVKAKLV